MEFFRFRDDELVTVCISVFCGVILSNKSGVKIVNFFGASDIFIPFFI
jgi:hypothetical protein